MASFMEDQSVRVVHNSYATERWASCVLPLVMSDSDTRTIHDWGRAVGLSSSSLISRCRAAHISPKKTLDLARILRALRVTDGNIAELEEVLDIIEPRTLVRLLVRSGLRTMVEKRQRVTLYEFLDIQVSVTNSRAIGILRTLLQDRMERKRAYIHN